MSIKRFRRRIAIITLALAIAIPMAMAIPAADDSSVAESPPSAQGDGAVGDTDTATTQELVAQLRKLRRQQPEGETLDEKVANYREVQNNAIDVARRLYAKTANGDAAVLPMAVLAVQSQFESLVSLYRLKIDFPVGEFRKLAMDAERLYDASLANAEIGLDIATQAAQISVQALSVGQQMEDEEAGPQMVAFVDKLSLDRRAEIAELGAQLKKQLRYVVPSDADAEAIAEVAHRLKEDFANVSINLSDMGLIMQVLARVESASLTEMSVDLNVFFASRFSKSDDEDVRGYADQLAGAARRLQLLGNSIDLSGTYFDGTELDWASYSGKVVLIDYWATWCGPCKAEIPNVLSNFERYHDRGFEVLGISLDDDRQKVDAFLKQADLPWKTLFSDDATATGWKHPMARRYGISGIPTVILVNQDGNVVSLNARGEELGRLLAELFDGADDSSKEGADEAATNNDETDRDS